MLQVWMSFLSIVNLTTEGQMHAALQSVSCTHRFLPNLKRLSLQQTVIDRLQEVAAQAKEILREPMKREKPLSLNR